MQNAVASNSGAQSTVDLRSAISRQECSESALTGMLNQNHMYRLWSFIQGRTTYPVFGTVRELREVSDMLTSWKARNPPSPAAFTFHWGAHFVAARLVPGTAAALPMLEVVDSLRSAAAATALHQLVMQADNQPWRLSRRSTTWQIEDGGAGIASAIDGCGCYAIHAAYMLACGKSVSSLPRPSGQAIAFLRSVASQDPAQIPTGSYSVVLLSVSQFSKPRPHRV